MALSQVPRGAQSPSFHGVSLRSWVTHMHSGKWKDFLLIVVVLVVYFKSTTSQTELPRGCKFQLSRPI